MRLKVLTTLLLVALFTWGCSNENPVQPDNSADQALAEISDQDFRAQVDEVMITAETATEEQADQFKQELESLIEASFQVEPEADEQDFTIRSSSSSVSSGGHWIRTVDGPTVITHPGLYIVTRDFSADNDAIVVQSDYVLLWLAGHTLTGPGAKEGRGIVIEDSRFCAVYGGKVDNFGIGLQLINTSKSSVRWMKVKGQDEFADPGAGITPQIGTMLINSPKNCISGNAYHKINLGIFVRGSGSMHNRVSGNYLVGGDHGLLGICYNPAPGGGSDDGPSKDKIKFNVIKQFGLGLQTTGGSTKNLFARNVVYYYNAPYQDLNGTNIFRNNHFEQLPPAASAALNLSFDGLENLGADYVYEGWVIVDGMPVSTGTFTVDETGTPSVSTFWVQPEQLANAVKFVLTIEPADDPDPGPSSTHYLAGDFGGASAALTVSDPAALSDDFMSAMGPYILNTPSTGSDDSDYHAGIWWLDPAGGFSPTLVLPTLPAGWEYEGWVVGPGGPVTTGKFTEASGFDSDLGGPTAGPDPTPPFPGQDYINPLMSLIGYAAVITIEPSPDNSPMPFTLKPLVDGSVDDVGIGVLQDMSNNAASFPTGMATR